MFTYHTQGNDQALPPHCLFPTQTHVFIFFSFLAVSISEVEALFELFKSISGSVIDDGLINKVNARRPSFTLNILPCLPY